MPPHAFTQKEGEHIAMVVAEIVSTMSLNTAQNSNVPQLTSSLCRQNLPTTEQRGNSKGLRYNPALDHQTSFISAPPTAERPAVNIENLNAPAKTVNETSGSSSSSGCMTIGTGASSDMKEYEQWQYVEARINHMFPPDRRFGKASPFVPRTLKEWIAHREAMDAAEAEISRRKQVHEATQKAMGNPERFQAKPFYGKQFGSFAQGNDGDGLEASPNPPTRSAVLAQHTIWVGLNCPVAPPWRLPAPWPCKQEMEWEGDQRVATESGRFGRFPPLPRIDTQTDTVVWHLKPRVKHYAFDEVWRVPNEEDVIAPVDDIEDPEVVSQLVNKELLDAMDDEV